MDVGSSSGDLVASALALSDVVVGMPTGSESLVAASRLISALAFHASPAGIILLFYRIILTA